MDLSVSMSLSFFLSFFLSLSLLGLSVSSYDTNASAYSVCSWVKWDALLQFELTEEALVD